MANNTQTAKEVVILQALMEENEKLRKENQFKSTIIKLLQDQVDILENDLLKIRKTTDEAPIAEIKHSMFSQHNGGING